jgi:hypothetical protein
LFAVIDFQAAAHRAGNPGGNGSVSGSTHLAPVFWERCRRRIGWPSSGDGGPMPRGDAPNRVEIFPTSHET